MTVARNGRGYSVSKSQTGARYDKTITHLWDSIRLLVTCDWEDSFRIYLGWLWWQHKRCQRRIFNHWQLCEMVKMARIGPEGCWMLWAFWSRKMRFRCLRNPILEVWIAYRWSISQLLHSHFSAQYASHLGWWCCIWLKAFFISSSSSSLMIATKLVTWNKASSISVSFLRSLHISLTEFARVLLTCSASCLLIVADAGASAFANKCSRSHNLNKRVGNLKNEDWKQWTEDSSLFVAFRILF